MRTNRKPLDIDDNYTAAKWVIDWWPTAIQLCGIQNDIIMLERQAAAILNARGEFPKAIVSQAELTLKTLAKSFSTIQAQEPATLEQIIELAYRLGTHRCQLLTSVRLLQLEPTFARGIKIWAAAKAGHQAVHGSDEEKAARNREYVTEFRKTFHPGDQRTIAYNKVAKKFGVSPKTISRAVLAADKKS